MSIMMFRTRGRMSAALADDIGGDSMLYALWDLVCYWEFWWYCRFYGYNSSTFVSKTEYYHHWILTFPVVAVYTGGRYWLLGLGGELLSRRGPVVILGDHTPATLHAQLDFFTLFHIRSSLYSFFQTSFAIIYIVVIFYVQVNLIVA